MKLKGGIIIIGSLIWEDHLKEKNKDLIRKNWRQQNLLPIIKTTPVPIRYGRKSSSREDTYTMIFTKGCETSLGQGLILEFNEVINSFEQIERQSIALAIAEGIYTEINKRISTTWGSVGLLLNPKLKNIDLPTYELLTNKWSDIYRQFHETFFPGNYKCINDSEPPITQNGLLSINWKREMDEFDFLLATPVVPIPNRMLTEKEISDKIISSGYYKYFKNNLAGNITTHQDKIILENLPKSNFETYP